MAWLVLTLELDAARAEAISDALLEAGAISVSVEDAAAGTAQETPQFREPETGGLPADAEPGIALWPSNRICALVPSQVDANAVVKDAARAAGLDRVPEFGIARVEDDDWVSRTQSQFEPIEIGERLWVVPSWREPPRPNAVVLRLDPGLAFGTGSHPTTRLALRFLERALRDFRRPAPASERRSEGRAAKASRRSTAEASVPGVLDYGCGSGILAIAAAKLGAGKVDATDLDPRALDATASNARRNDVDVRVVPPQALPAGDYDVVVANILANPLIELAARLVRRTRPGGRLALSGILETQASEVIDAYAPDMALSVAETDEGWVLLEGTRVPRAAKGGAR